MTLATTKDGLALDGGEPAVTGPLPPMYPGGMRIGVEEETAVLKVLRRRRLFRYYGPGDEPSAVAELERKFAERLGVSHALAVSSGTTALTCALAALGIGPGDEVIVPAYTWIATAAAVATVGAVPIIADVDESLTLDPESVRCRITDRTKALLPVHMRGAPADMGPLLDIAREHGLYVLEDTAQAIGGRYRGARLGTVGDIGAFSLQFNKILTSGEGGVVVTQDERLYQRAFMFHDVAATHRTSLPPEETFVGITCRMSELQGAVAGVQVERLDEIIDNMRSRKRAIKDEIADLARRKEIEFRRLNDDDGDTGLAIVFFLPNQGQAQFVVEALKAEGAGANVLFDPKRSDLHIARYWKPLLEQRSWSASGGPWQRHGRPVRYDEGMWARSLDLLGRAVHLNISPELSEKQTAEIGTALTKVLTAL